METEKASHATEESLSIASLSSAHLQMDKLIGQLQNGSASPQVDPHHHHQQLNGDTTWGLKPSNGSSPGINPMKRHKESSPCPADLPSLFEPSAVYTMNGDMTNGVNKQPQLGPMQPKRPRANDMQVNGAEMDAWERTHSGGTSGQTDGFLELTKLPPQQADNFQCNSAMQDDKLDGKRNSNLHNGDLFSLPRSKSVPISNGAIGSLGPMRETPGDLLEKTLSQYYPEQISITPQTGQSSVSSERSELSTQSPSITSGFPVATPKMSASDMHARVTPQSHDNSGGYDNQFVVNGFSSSFEGELHQHPQPKSEQQQEPLLDLPDLQQPHSLDQVPGVNKPHQMSPGSQLQNPSDSYHCNPGGQSFFSKPNTEFNQNLYLPSIDSSTPPHAINGNGYGPFSCSIGPTSTPEHQEHTQHGVQQQKPQALSCQSDQSTLQGSPGQALLTTPTPVSGSVSEPEPQDSPSAGQGPIGRLEGKSSLAHAQGMSQMGSQMGWIELNTQAPVQSAGMPPVWGGFPPQPQQDQQPPANLEGLGQTHDCKGFLGQGSKPPDFKKQQQQDSQTQDWQQSGSKSSPKGSLLGPSNLQHMPQHCRLQPQQADSSFFAQQEHLCKDQDLDQILSPNFIPPHKPPPHPQHEVQPPENVPQRPHSQDSHSNTTTQPSNPELLNHLQMESYAGTEQQQQLKSPTYRAQPGPSLQSLPSLSPQLTGQQPQNDQAMFGFDSTDGSGMKGNLEFQKAMEMQKQQHQTQYSQNPSVQRQYPQQHPQGHHRRTPNQNDYPRPLPGQMPPPIQQVPGQVFPKVEHPEVCAQYRPRALPSPGPQADFQKHAALRMHLLQKQERHGSPQHQNNVSYSLPFIKQEGGPRFESPQGLPRQPCIEQVPTRGSNGTLAVVKQEPPSPSYDQTQQQRSILATMEQQLSQYQLSPVFEKKSLVVKSPNKVKVEMSGGVTVLSTNVGVCVGEDVKPPEIGLKKEPGLQSFLESPMKLLDTPIKNLLDTPVKTQYEISPCHCVDQISEKDEGPYYTHLGAASSLAGIRAMMEKRSGYTGSAIRIEKVVYTGKEGKSTQGCPIAKWVIRRASVDEKLLVLVRERPSHKCETACLIVVILIWEGISAGLADRLYMELSSTLTKHGALTNRRCALNEERTCACQGLDPEACGASFSFGCSWSMYYNGCKFARSKIPRKFKLLGDDPREEERLEQNLQSLATVMSPLYKKMAPDAYNNQVEHEHRAPDCRLGLKEGRPFSGVTACVDFCAHAHRDLHNMQGGSTVVCTLTREDNRQIGKIPEDEQLHVLPLYKASNTDEFGSEEAQLEKARTGAIQVLTTFRRQVRMLAEPAKSCRQKKLDAKRASANKLAGNSDTPNSKAAQAKKQSTYENTSHGTPASGAQAGNLHGQNQQQSLSQPFPGSPHAAGYPRVPSANSPFPSTPKPGVLYPQSPVAASPYPSPLHVPTSYMNGGSPSSPYPSALTPNNLYPGYQCNGGMAMEGYHSYYPGGPKPLDMYRHQRPAMYPDQQYGGHPRYGVNYPPRYGEPGLQVNGFGNCAMRPGVHPVGPYSPYPPNGGPEAQFLDALSRPPSAHPSLDYASVGKCNQFGGYPGAYLPQNPQMFPASMDPLRMQTKTEMNLPGANGMPLIGSNSLLPGAQPPFAVPNGGMQGGAMIKQEPIAPVPTTPKTEDVWSDNEHNFLDPEIGGVAVAPSHGSILIECAKRELHATTPLKRPNRTHPTRISLVFYQHKNMNEAKHGLALWEAKLAEKAREKEEETERNGGIPPESTPSKGGKKVKREPPEHTEPTEPPYKRFIQTLKERSMSSTTNSYVGTAPYAFTKVTGPYNCFM